MTPSFETKIKMFNAYVGHNMGGHEKRKFTQEDIEKRDMVILEMEIDEMTGRQGVW